MFKSKIHKRNNERSYSFIEYINTLFLIKFLYLKYKDISLRFIVILLINKIFYKFKYN